MNSSSLISSKGLSFLCYTNNVRRVQLLVHHSWGEVVEWKLASLPVHKHDLSCGHHVWFSSLFQFPLLHGQLFYEVLFILPFLHLVYASDMLWLNMRQNIRDVVAGIIDPFSANATSQYAIDVALSLSHVNNTRTIDQVNSLCQSNVLPHLRFTRNRCSLTHLLLF